MQLIKKKYDLGDLGSKGNALVRGLMYLGVGAALSGVGALIMTVTLVHQHGILASVTSATAFVSVHSQLLKTALQVFQATR